jgi:predicted RNase H-like HicB family nuclease
MTAKLSIVCSRQNNGSYFALCPELNGCYTQGDSYEQAINNIHELITETITVGYEGIDMDFLTSSKSKIFSEYEVFIN